MNNNYWEKTVSNETSETDTQEIPDEFLKTVSKQDLREALFFLLGLRDGTGSGN